MWATEVWLLGRPNLKWLWKDLHGERVIARAKTGWGKSVGRQREQRTQASVTGRGVWVAVERFDQTILILEACPVGRGSFVPRGAAQDPVNGVV